MVDFSKLRIPPCEPEIVVYQCLRCEKRIEYVCKLPAHMRFHQELGVRCGGEMVDVTRRKQMAKRSEVAGERASERAMRLAAERLRKLDAERLPDGTINNCSLKHGEPEKDCQMCGGHCPDRDRYPVPGREQTDQEIEADLLGAPEFMPQPRTLTVVWGEETFQPIQFHGFRVGPLSMTVFIAPGSDMQVVYRQVWNRLDALAHEQFGEKMAAYLDRVKELAVEVERRKSR